MTTLKPLVIRITTKIVLQIMLALILSIVILFFVHYKVDAGFMAFSNSWGNLNLDCPIQKFGGHTFIIGHDNYRVTSFPNYNMLYLKSGISHWGYILLGTTLFTLIFQIKIRIVMVDWQNDFNDKQSRFIGFIFVLSIFLAGIYYLYTQTVGF